MLLRPWVYSHSVLAKMKDRFDFVRLAKNWNGFMDRGWYLGYQSLSHNFRSSGLVVHSLMKKCACVWHIAAISFIPRIHISLTKMASHEGLSWEIVCDENTSDTCKSSLSWSHVATAKIATMFLTITREYNFVSQKFKFLWKLYCGAAIRSRFA